MPNPTVDILMATYNGERFVGEQIESIQRQTYQNWRLLVSDDCSSDGTLNVVKAYAAKDSRISVVSEGVRYGGAKENFFSLMRYSSAPYFMFCDQDDVWLPEKVALELDEVRKFSTDKPLAVYTDMKVVDENLKEIVPSFLDQERKRDIEGNLCKMLSISSVAGCTLLGNAVLRDMVAETDSSAALMHDWWLSLVAASCGTIQYIDETTNLYRQHADNEVGAEGYSFLVKVRGYRESRRKYWLSCKQAAAILEEYGDCMHNDAYKVVSAYAAQLHQGRFKSLEMLSRVGLLKEGAGRLAGQILTVLLGAPRNISTAVDDMETQS
jgi:glycosyltransferase involved in cell wall biosynthesis